MAILINSMKMPTSCATCKLFGEYGCPLIGTVTYALTRGKRHKDCPLIPVPPHGDLIDRDALKKQAGEFYDPMGCILGVAVEDIDDAPTIIPTSEEDET